MIRIVIADDHALFREGLVRLLDAVEDIDLVGVAANGSEALNLVFELKPDVLLLDISMPDLDGRRVAEQLAALRSTPRVLFLTMHRSRHVFHSAMDRGHSCGYVLKESAFDELIAAIRAIMAGEEYVSKTIADFANNVDKGAELTTRELDVLRLTAGGRTTREVAKALGISSRTVENHRAHILEKMRAANMVAAVNECIRRGVI